MARRSRSKIVVAPIAQELPSGIAASIGKMIARHSHLEWMLANILYALLSIPISQGRVAVKIPPPRLYITTVADLLVSLRLHLDFNLAALERKLLAADNARNILCHSIFVRDTRSRKLHIQLASGSWDEGDDVETARKNLRGDNVEVTRAFLAEKRAAIEDGIDATRRFADRVSDGLQALNESRRNRRTLDRRGR